MDAVGDNNDVLSLIESIELQWKADEVHDGTVTKVIQALRDVLWYIDGSHATLAEQSCEVPELFQKFNGYNKPEIHKHRKRQVASLSWDVLLAHSQNLFGILQFPFWNRPKWLDVKSLVENLARSLASYADLLLAKRMKMQVVHSSQEVVRNISQNLTVRFTGVRAMPPTFLAPVCEAIVAAGPDVPQEVGALLPSDRRRRYEWMQEIKRGLQVPLVHVTYAPGSSVGNLHWIPYTQVNKRNSLLGAYWLLSACFFPGFTPG